MTDADFLIKHIAELSAGRAEGEKMDIVKINYQLEKIYEKYAAISKIESAEVQNAIDIVFAYDNGEINTAEFTFLKKQNRKIYNMLIERNEIQ